MVYSIDPSLLDVQKGQFLSIGGKKNGISRKDLITLGQDIPEDVYKMVSRELNAKHGHL